MDVHAPPHGRMPGMTQPDPCPQRRAPPARRRAPRAVGAATLVLRRVRIYGDAYASAAPAWRTDVPRHRGAWPAAGWTVSSATDAPSPSRWRTPSWRACASPLCSKPIAAAAAAEKRAARRGGARQRTCANAQAARGANAQAACGANAQAARGANAQAACDARLARYSALDSAGAAVRSALGVARAATGKARRTASENSKPKAKTIFYRCRPTTYYY